MKKNIGYTDKIIRLIIAFVILLLVWFDVVTNYTIQIVLLVIASIAAITSFLDFCPLYVPFKINTDKHSVSAESEE